MQKQKNKTIESLRINSKDVGSSEVQIGLLKAVNQRKRLLEYLKRENPESYTKILTKLDLRK